MGAMVIHPGNAPQIHKHFEGNPKYRKREKEQEREYLYRAKWKDV